MVLAMKLLLLDTQNLLHRARSGFKKGDHYVVYNFFRALRPLVERFVPDQIAFVLEGTPHRRIAQQPDYKGTRVSLSTLDEVDPRRKELESFYRQVETAMQLLYCLPVGVVRNLNHECDDTIANLAWSAVEDLDAEVTIVSTDTDFIQLLDNERIRLFNPVKKEFVTHDWVGEDYVIWKALIGDGSDNIKGFDGVGPKIASKMICEDTNDQEELESVRLWSKHVFEVADRERYNHNIDMIRFETFTDAEWDQNEVLSAGGDFDWEDLHDGFTALGFKSMTNDSTWKKYRGTFEKLGLGVKAEQDAV